MIEVLATGGPATIQDLGRPGYAHLGVGRSGAADRAALRLANRLVGNAAGAAGVEITLGGFAFVAIRPVTVALTGAVVAGRLGWGAAVSLAAGERVTLGRPAAGLRSYLAVRGGVAVEPVLGSRSTDTLGGLGPPPLRTGDRLPAGEDIAEAISGAVATPAPASRSVTVIPGPREDWFDPAAIEKLTAAAWRVGADADRVGLRLDGPRPARRRDGELATEGTRPGAIQVPPDGRPIILGPDAPVTGGYPVIAVVADADLDAVGQLGPGDEVRLRLRRTR